MTEAARPIAASDQREIRQILTAVLACFLASGAVGLVYEVLWIRMLGLIFGHTVFAITTVLATFMGGLALGSYLFGRIADRSHRLLAFYGLLEIGIGLYCLLLPWLLGLAARLYLAASRSLDPSYLVFSLIQFGLVALLLLPPTCLMGATLPVLVRFFVREEAALGRQVGLLYSVNTLGAVLGTALAGYVLVPTLGIRTSLQLAVVSNLGLGVLVLVFDRHLRRLGLASSPPADLPAAKPEPLASGWSGWAVLAGFAVSGAASMVYEVTWSRALTLVIGSSTYAFTAMLIAFLCGIAGGSWAFAALVGRRALAPSAFGLLQLGIGLSALALVPAFARMPGWFLGLFQFSQAPWFIQAVQMVLSFTAMLLPTLLIGATFPCVVRVLAQGLGRVGSVTGRIYAVNTLGAILGAVFAGFLAVPLLGVQWTMRVGIWMNLGVAALVLLGAPPARRLLRGVLATAVALGAAATAVLPFWDPAVMSSGVAIYGQRYLPLLRLGDLARTAWRPDVLYYRDGISATVSVHRNGPDVYLRVNGKTDAGNASDMHTQLFSGHLPMLLHPAPKRVLIIGLGSGVTAGAVAQYPVERIDIIEIEGAVVEASRFFARENRNVLADPRVRLIVADGRNFLQSTATRYDAIISEPSNPWIRGLASLFTTEFFALAQSRLAPEGVMVQWIQGYGIAPDDLRMVAATFRTAFPHASLWSTRGGDNLLVGTPGRLQIPLARIAAQAAGSSGLRDDLRRVGLESAPGLLADFVLGEDELARYAAGTGVNTDDRLPLEFSAPKNLYEVQTAEVNDRILRSYRRAPLPPLPAADLPALDSPEGRHALGKALLSKGLAAEADAQFARAVELDPRHIPSQLERAALLLDRGQVLRAVRLLEEVLVQQRHHPQAHALLGKAYEQQGLPREALAAYRRAADLAPEDLDVRRHLARLRRQAGDLAGAAAELQAVRARRPYDLAAVFGLVEIHLANRRPDAALAELAPLLPTLEEHPALTRARIRQLSGLAHLQAGRPADALADLRAAVSLHPFEAQLHLELSFAYEAAGRLDAALEALDRLLALDPQHLVGLERLRALLQRLEPGT